MLQHNGIDFNIIETLFLCFVLLFFLISNTRLNWSVFLADFWWFFFLWIMCKYLEKRVKSHFVILEMSFLDCRKKRNFIIIQKLK